MTGTHQLTQIDMKALRAARLSRLEREIAITEVEEAWIAEEGRRAEAEFYAAAYVLDQIEHHYYPQGASC